MTNLLPIGTVVRLHNGTIDVMIIGRFPLYNQEGTIGYFDYVACQNYRRVVWKKIFKKTQGVIKIGVGRKV